MKTIILIGGYKDASGTLHREVEITKRLLGCDLFDIEANELSVLQTNRESLILSHAITKFGTLKMPTPLTALLALDSIDRDDLLDAYNDLESEGSGGRKPK
ncbi:MAG: hypothetical protein WCD76_07020, partial [Pyrinomonadaceae bacterium]